MNDTGGVLVWERQELPGKGTPLYSPNTKLLRTLEQIRPEGLDLDQMVRDGEATLLIGPYYVLTTEGLNSFTREADSQSDSAAVQYLKNETSQYWFRSASEG